MNIIPTTKNRSSAKQELVFFNYRYGPMVEEIDFSLVHENKRISNRNLVLMRHIFQRSQFKIIK